MEGYVILWIFICGNCKKSKVDSNKWFLNLVKYGILGAHSYNKAFMTIQS